MGKQVVQNHLRDLGYCSYGDVYLNVKKVVQKSHICSLLNRWQCKTAVSQDLLSPRLKSMNLLRNNSVKKYMLQASPLSNLAALLLWKWFNCKLSLLIIYLQSFLGPYTASMSTTCTRLWWAAELTVGTVEMVTALLIPHHANSCSRSLCCTWDRQKASPQMDFSWWVTRIETANVSNQHHNIL